MNADLRSLGESTWPIIADAPLPVVVIPIGSCEQHGLHLPLDTDTRIAIAVCRGLAAAHHYVFVAPPIGITASGEHNGFPGTLSIGAEATQTVIIELVRSADWASGVVLVNGHGGNAVASNGASALLLAEGHRVLNWWPRIQSGDAHAGRTETSLMLAIAPHLVRLDFAQPGRSEPIAELLPSLRSLGMLGVSPNGVLGDPTGATAAHGQQLLAAMIDDLVARVDAWRT